MPGELLVTSVFALKFILTRSPSFESTESGSEGQYWLNSSNSSRRWPRCGAAVPAITYFVRNKSQTGHINQSRAPNSLQEGAWHHFCVSFLSQNASPSGYRSTTVRKAFDVSSTDSDA